jgi:glucose/arabinose dehydrogenase
MGVAFALAVMATACVPDESGTATVDPFDNNASQTVSEPPNDTIGSTRRTIPEEAPSSTGATVTFPTTEPELGPLPEPPWTDERFDLQPIAQASTMLGFATRSGTDDLWLAERDGRVRVVQRRVSLDGGYEAVKLLNTVVLDITDKVGTAGEGGLLGLDFSTNGDYLYVSYTDKDGGSVVAEYRMGPIQALPETERIVMTVPQPYANHNGGQITFGPDGFLYFALGDGGSSGDPEGNGQNLDTLLGSILRIDPFEPPENRSYAVPADNPFVDRFDAKPEIWLYGVRNPWRFSFDHATGDLWIGDVGQNEIEEIDWLPSTGGRPAGYGANLGWDIMEGDRLFEGDAPPDNHVAPVFTYGHDFGRCSVTGGYVYRGKQNENLAGAYVFADYCSGEVIGLRILDDGRILVSPLEFDRRLGQVVAFGQGPEQELYVLEADGVVSRIQQQQWRRETEVFEGDEAIPAGRYRVDVRAGPDDPVIADSGGD